MIAGICVLNRSGSLKITGGIWFGPNRNHVGRLARYTKTRLERINDLVAEEPPGLRVAEWESATAFDRGEDRWV